jgi:hypothetical protein
VHTVPNKILKLGLDDVVLHHSLGYFLLSRVGLIGSELGGG